jgi:hypothetical protein
MCYGEEGSSILSRALILVNSRNTFRFEIHQTRYHQLPRQVLSSPIAPTTIEQQFAMKYSGLQREVLSLYRTCLRESRKKPAVSLQYDALKLSSNRHRIPGCTSSHLQGRLCNLVTLYCFKGIDRASANLEGAGPNLKRALASTRRILVQSNTSYAKVEGSWKCIRLQELETCDEEGSTMRDGTNSRMEYELGRHDQMATFVDILRD